MGSPDASIRSRSERLYPSITRSCLHFGQRENTGSFWCNVPINAVVSAVAGSVFDAGATLLAHTVARIAGVLHARERSSCYAALDRKLATGLSPMSQEVGLRRGLRTSHAVRSAWLGSPLTPSISRSAIIQASTGPIERTGRSPVGLSQLDVRGSRDGLLPESQ
jgi:hypothetical protein